MQCHDERGRTVAHEGAEVAHLGPSLSPKRVIESRELKVHRVCRRELAGRLNQRLAIDVAAAGEDCVGLDDVEVRSSPRLRGQEATIAADTVLRWTDVQIADSHPTGFDQP